MISARVLLLLCLIALVVNLVFSRTIPAGKDDKCPVKRVGGSSRGDMNDHGGASVHGGQGCGAGNAANDGVGSGKAGGNGIGGVARNGVGQGRGDGGAMAEYGSSFATTGLNGGASMAAGAGMSVGAGMDPIPGMDRTSIAVHAGMDTGNGRSSFSAGVGSNAGVTHAAGGVN